MLLNDRVCLITGASSLRGIGYATAELFARNGARLAVVDVAMDEGIESDIRRSITQGTGREPDLLGLRCDIQNPSSCDEAVAAVRKRFGVIDGLVNCAGIVKAQPMLSILEQDYDRIMGVNLKGAFNICKSVLAAFEPDRPGTIVNVASVAAQRGGGLVGGAHYAASKGGVISLTRTIAREFGPRGRHARRRPQQREIRRDRRIGAAPACWVASGYRGRVPVPGVGSLRLRHWCHPRRERGQPHPLIQRCRAAALEPDQLTIGSNNKAKTRENAL
jgi:NAD(P)-dependent dehydrogenase (short-subunit alcohol dehydrogenase family)